MPFSKGCRLKRIFHAPGESPRPPSTAHLRVSRLPSLTYLVCWRLACIKKRLNLVTSVAYYSSFFMHQVSNIFIYTRHPLYLLSSAVFVDVAVTLRS